MRRFPAFARLAFALLLIAAQGAVVWVGLFRPNVSEIYRAMFIDKTIDDFPEPSFNTKGR